MSDVEDIKPLGDTSPQSSWIFVDDCDGNTTQNKYYLNCSTEPVTELTETVEKKELESDSDSISIISESDDSKEAATENKEEPENGPLVKKDDNIAKDPIAILYSRLYAFGCLLLAVILPILLNYIMHNTASIVPTYLKEYQPERDEFRDNFLDILSDDIKPLPINKKDNTKPSYADSKDSGLELINVNVVEDEKDRSYDELKRRSSNQETRNENYKIKVKEVVKIEGVPSNREMNFQPVTQRKIKQKHKTNLKQKSNVRSETSSEANVDKMKNRDYKIKTKNKSKKLLSEKEVKKEHKKATERGCGKELSKLRRTIVKQEKHIRELNKLLKDRERQIKIFQYKIFQEIKELKYMQSENNRFKSNFTHSVSGEWYDSYFDHRDKTRKHKREADWFFDRAHYRHKKRISDKNWYINWMLQREDYRKRTDWQFSF